MHRIQCDSLMLDNVRETVVGLASTYYHPLQVEACYYCGCVHTSAPVHKYHSTVMPSWPSAPELPQCHLVPEFPRAAGTRPDW